MMSVDTLDAPSDDTPRSAYSLLERRVTIIVVGCLVGLAGIAWLLTIQEAPGMANMGSLALVGAPMAMALSVPLFIGDVAHDDGGDDVPDGRAHGAGPPHGDAPSRRKRAFLRRLRRWPPVRLPPIPRVRRRHDGRHASGDRRWRGRGGCRRLPVHAVEEQMPACLPDSTGLHHDSRLPAGQSWCSPGRAIARSLLPRLLLGPDDSAAGGRADEPHLDGRPGGCLPG